MARVGGIQMAANDEKFRRVRHSEGIVYFPSALLQASLPVRQHLNSKVWERSSQNVSLRLASGTNAQGQPIGLPFGSLARTLVSWVSTEAKRTRSPEIRLGSTIGSLQWSLGLGSSGGENGVNTRLREQMRRLFACSATVERRQEDVINRGTLWTTIPISWKNLLGAC